MIIAVLGLPGVGKTTFSKTIEQLISSNDKEVIIKKLSNYVEEEQGKRCSLPEINEFYYAKLELEGNSYWASKIMQDSQGKTLILDGVWYINELERIVNTQSSNYIGVYLEEDRTVLYERACITTIKKNEDIYEMKRVMDIIKTFDFSQFNQYITIRGHCDSKTIKKLMDRITEIQSL